MLEPIGPIWPSLAVLGWTLAIIEFAFIRHQWRVMVAARQTEEESKSERSYD